MPYFLFFFPFILPPQLLPLSCPPPPNSIGWPTSKNRVRPRFLDRMGGGGGQGSFESPATLVFSPSPSENHLFSPSHDMLFSLLYPSHQEISFNFFPFRIYFTLLTPFSHLSFLFLHILLFFSSRLNNFFSQIKQEAGEWGRIIFVVVDQAC